jgi:hypothetical protein
VRGAGLAADAAMSSHCLASTLFTAHAAVACGTHMDKLMQLRESDAWAVALLADAASTRQGQSHTRVTLKRQGHNGATVTSVTKSMCWCTCLL